MKKSGNLFGFIPYDFRFPTMARIRERIWNPDDARILVPRVFGIGWTFNLAALKERSTVGFYLVLALYGLAFAGTMRKAARRLGRD